MGKSILAAVREAVLAGPAEHAVDDEVEGDNGAAALEAKENSMSTSDTPAGGDKRNAGISQTEHEAAVKAAAEAGIETGRAEGIQAATDRLAAAFGAGGIKGDGQRMSAALDLAIKSPGMSGEDVAAFVVANVAAGSKIGADAAAYEAERLAAAGLAQPSGDRPARKSKIDTAGIYAARRQRSQEG